MVLLRSLSGKTAGQETVIRRFPFCVGRGAAADLKVEVAGVWDRHFLLERRADLSVTVQAGEGATTLVNGSPVTQGQLRLGDLIQAGAARFSFGLSPPRQTGLAVRETLTWIGLALLTGLQIFIALTIVP